MADAAGLVATMRGQPVDARRRMNPGMLIAAAINPAGNLDLAAFEAGRTEAGARVEFCLDSEGEVFQRRYWTACTEPFGEVVARVGEAEPLDMIFLAECLTHTFGEHTPLLFRLAEPSSRKRPRLALPGAARDRERIQLLHDAFSLYLLAYEEHLI